MYVLYEEDGDIKAGSILADNDSSLQIESQHGKRGKLKANSVLLRFAAPSPAQVMDAARALKDDLDLDFLWEAAGEEEFAFETLAADYFGHAATPAEAAAIVLALHNAPINFQKKGKGRYKAAAADILAAAKAGLIGFSKSLAREIGSRGITVNVVAPGFIDTDMTQVLGEEVRKKIIERIVIPRLGTPAEIASAVAFLASPESGYITGQTLQVNGGMYMN